jgi:hypothetical protein
MELSCIDHEDNLLCEGPGVISTLRNGQSRQTARNELCSARELTLEQEEKRECLKASSGAERLRTHN